MENITQKDMLAIAGAALAIAAAFAAEKAYQNAAPATTDDGKAATPAPAYMALRAPLVVVILLALAAAYFAKKGSAAPSSYAAWANNPNFW